MASSHLFSSESATGGAEPGHGVTRGEDGQPLWPPISEPPLDQRLDRFLRMMPDYDPDDPTFAAPRWPTTSPSPPEEGET